jgi:hypothetical protein
MIMSMKIGIIFVIDTIGWLVQLDNLFFKEFFNMSIIIIIFFIIVTTDINFEIALSCI